jgi:hypothetical protein
MTNIDASPDWQALVKRLGLDKTPRRDCGDGLDSVEQMAVLTIAAMYVSALAVG